jgi:LysM repeat protein
MKILKIFGVVVAVHAAVFMFVFAIPGCRTTARSTPPPPTADTSSTPTTVSYPGTAGNGPVAAASGDASPSLNGADLNPGTTDGTPTLSFNAGSASGSQHFNPTRPGTPVADVLQSGEVTGVTPASTYKVVSNDSLWKVAKKHGIGVDDLAKANNLRPSSPLKVGQKLIIPGKPGASSSANGGTGAASSTRTYTVKSGESLGSIARKQGTTTATIRALNPQMKSDTVRVGQDLTLPSASPSSSSSSATASTPSASPVAAQAPIVAPSGSVEHIVKPGEGLSQIAKKYGVPMREIAALNNIANPTSLRAGQKIIIPGVKTPAPAPSTIPPLDLTPVAPVTPSENPVAPAPSVDSNPVSTPVSDASTPPVVKVEESTPVAPATK